ncbi:pilus assembly protein [Yersinia alsatica]|uniref:pilus assembly protein n=1 Tax=Yersinia alsatica TaxID=2890317 RepID=UPI0011A6FEDB|nr:pilus assembly protein [Yersinia alsatica]
MMIAIAKSCATVQRKTQEFLKNQRGSIIEYVMIIALAGIFIGLAKPTLTDLVTKSIAQAATSINLATGADAGGGGGGGADAKPEI